MHGAWRTSLANKDHKLCPTYPSELLVPALISDAELEKCASVTNEKSTLSETDDDVICNGIQQLPFEEIPGEWTTRMAKTRDGRVVLSNYRLHVSIDHQRKVEQDGPQSSINYGIGMNVPLGCIEGVEQRDLFFLEVNCKDGRYYRIRYDDNSSCEEWQKYVNEAISAPSKIQDVFAFGHRAWAEEQGRFRIYSIFFIQLFSHFILSSNAFFDISNPSQNMK